MASSRPRCRVPAQVSKQEGPRLAAACAPCPLSLTALVVSQSLSAAGRAKARLLQIAGAGGPARAETARMTGASWLG